MITILDQGRGWCLFDIEPRPEDIPHATTVTKVQAGWLVTFDY